ncbi:MAG: S8 family peptidase [candidate division Zixibacteria bacterium]|nr:S8 family peptidase [candidate division Zixibacteria bacterium]
MNSIAINRIASALLFGLLIIAVSHAAEMSPSLLDVLSRVDQANADSLVSVVLFADAFDVNRDVQRLGSASSSTFKARHAAVIEHLKSANSGLLSSLKNQVKQIHNDASIKEFWVAPALAFEIPLAKIAQLSSLPGVTSIIQDAHLDYIRPVENAAVAKTASAVSSHLEKLNIPAVWRRGITGKGRLVCNFDTGVEGTHPALAHNWRGNHAAFNACFLGPYATGTVPSDKSGHGTHTMGVMVGSTPSDSFGVAPDAEWICAAVVDQGQTLSRTVSDILEAFQWAIDPDGNPNTVSDVPDVILNSWGVPQSLFPPCDQTFSQAIDNVEAAGIVTIFAAGNEGPDSASLRIPADNATSPLNTFAVGAIDDVNNVIAGFSSRGPSACDQTQKKPEVVAPGVSIYSSYKDSSYHLMTGTSMAAPFIAGMVALLRQYNPDATVEQVKTAIILSARDMGEAGEDNVYGYGLPDADLALSYMPTPALPSLMVEECIIQGDNILDPGEAANLFVKLSAPTGGLDTVTGRIETTTDGVTFGNDIAGFFFPEGIMQAMNVVPFEIQVSDSLIHGTVIDLTLYIDFPNNGGQDTLYTELTVGRAPNGTLLTHVTERVQFTVTDFGQFGLGANSIYPAGGKGLTLDGSSNLLYEAGIIIGRNALQLSSSVRDSLGRADQSDFTPTVSLSASNPAIDGGYRSDAVFVDNASEFPIPIAVRQIVSSYDAPGEEGYLIVRYFLINKTNEPVSNLRFGFLADFDLNDDGDLLGYDGEHNLLYQNGGTSAAGMVMLENLAGALSLENVDGKLSLTDQDKYAYIMSTGIDIATHAAGDYLTILTSGPHTLAPGDSVELALALVVGTDMNDMYASVQRALQRYHSVTSVEDYYSSLPESFVLHQNYPNPFNPSTVIAFDLPRTMTVELTVINVLGQEVTTLLDETMAAGTQSIVWDGVDKNGRPVASGMYFYRLKTDSGVQTRKMLMLK